MLHQSSQYWTNIITNREVVVILWYLWYYSSLNCSTLDITGLHRVLAVLHYVHCSRFSILNTKRTNSSIQCYGQKVYPTYLKSTKPNQNKLTNQPYNDPMLDCATLYYSVPHYIALNLSILIKKNNQTVVWGVVLWFISSVLDWVVATS